MVHGNPVGVGSIGLRKSKNEGRSGRTNSVDVQENPANTIPIKQYSYNIILC